MMCDNARTSPIPASEGEDFVRDCYRTLLHRAPDGPGLEAHLKAMKRGTSRERLYYEIRVSPEGCRVREPVGGLRIGAIRCADLLRENGAAFVDAVYLALLGRTPLEGEMSANLSTLSRGVSRETVITAVAASPEAADWGTRLTGLFRARALRKGKDTLKRIPAVAKLAEKRARPKTPKPIRERAPRGSLTGRIRRSRDNLVHINRLAERVDQLEQTLSGSLDSIRGEIRLREVLREHDTRLSTNLAYKQFEDEMRGSREEILARLEVYSGVVEQVRAHCGPSLFALDLGCGRGEWLELMQTRFGIASLGIDSDPTMIRDCESRGLMTVRADILEHLRNRVSGSVDIVTLFQVAEHLPISILLDVLAECYRVLRPGGALIVETPNPENLIVGACNFSMDPTHITKLPPPLLKTLVRGAGFPEADILRLHPYSAIPEERLSDAPEALREAAGFLNQCADYAVTAFRGREAVNQA